MKRYLDLCEAIIKEHREVFRKLDITQLSQILNELIKADTVFVAGIGREGISMRSFAMRLAHLGKRVYWVWDDTTVAMNPGDLFIIADGSANILSLENMLQKGKKAGARIILITSDPQGPHAQYADFILHIHATAYLSQNLDCVSTIQLMGNQFEQHLYMLGDIVIMLYMEKVGLTPNDLEKRHRNIE